MSNERIDFSELEDLQESWEERLTEEGIKEALGNWLFDNGNELIAELKRCYEELDRPTVTIDDWDKAGPCVTVYLEGKEYVGILREYDASE